MIVGGPNQSIEISSKGGKQMNTETGASPAHQPTIQGSALKKRNQYSPNQWGHLEQFQVPCQLFINNTRSP
jgi:hypothetical protein